MPVSNTGLRWTQEEEARLYEETAKGMSLAEISTLHDRTTGGIRARQRQMGLRDETGTLIVPLPEFQSHRPAKREHVIKPSMPKHRKKPTSPKPAALVAAQPAAWPVDFPWDGNWIEKLWCALCHDLNTLLRDDRRPVAMIEREINIALARLSSRSRDAANWRIAKHLPRQMRQRAISASAASDIA